MSKNTQQTILIIIGLIAAWLLFVHLALMDLPQETRNLIGVLAVAALPGMVAVGFWLGRREATAERDGLAAGLKLSKSSAIRPTRYNARKRDEPQVDRAAIHRALNVPVVDATENITGE